MKETIFILACFFTALGYYLVIVDSRKEKNDEHLSFSSFMLWAGLDIITAISLYIKKGSWEVPALFTIGSVSIAIYFFCIGKRKWQKSDWYITGLIAICLYVWFTSGEINAALAANIATILASLDQQYTTWKNPDKEARLIWIAFLLCNISFFLVEIYAGKSITNYKDFVLYYLVPTVNGIGALILTINSSRKKK